MTTPQTQGRRPTYELFFVTGSEQKPFWTKIGAAWANRDNEGFGIKLDLLPAGGSECRLVMRKVKPRDTSGESQAASEAPAKASGASTAALVPYDEDAPF
ncbi:MAG: hypothetical protein ABL901_10110 [Hyphomicrobiaceae bacterium]